MINEERFWEASIAEAVRDKPPPDVTSKVLAGLAEADEPPAPKRGRPRLVRWGLEAGAAAAVVVAIGLATGILRLPGGDKDAGKLLPPAEVAGAPGAEYEYLGQYIELKHGWLLVTTGAPPVRCEGSELSNVDGRVLVHAGSVPTGVPTESVETWLKANNVETDMVSNLKHWATGTGLAALVLSGSAMLDGQEVKAPEPAPRSTAEWQIVRSVMDIDNLPDGTKFVNADGVSAALLDFLAEVQSIEAISIRDARGIRPDNLESLKVMKNLKWLDIRGAIWECRSDDEFEPATDLSISALESMPSLARVGVDLMPSVDGLTDDYDYVAGALPTLKRLSAKGVDVELGLWDPDSLDVLDSVLNDVPTLRGIELDNATEGEMKLLASHNKLRRVGLTSYAGGEVGLAYFARKGNLEELSLQAELIGLDQIHQISRMESLRILRIAAKLVDSPEQCFERIAGMKQLRELELGDLSLTEDALPAFASFKGREPFDRVKLARYAFAYDLQGMQLMLAQHIPTHRLEIVYKGLDEYRTLNDVPESLRTGDAAAHLTVLSWELERSTFYPDDVETAHVELYKAYPNLKRIEVRRGGFDTPVMEDQLVRWLKDNLPDVEVVVTP